MNFTKFKESKLLKLSVLFALLFVTITVKYFPKSLDLVTAGLSERAAISIALK